MYKSFLAKSTIFRILWFATIIHPTIMALTYWLDSLNVPVDWNSGSWAVLSILGIGWPIALVAHPDRSAKIVIIPIVIGTLIILPFIPEIFLFLMWSIGGFAP